MVMVGDDALMLRTQAGDRDAFAALIDRHKHKLVNYLTAMARDRDRAEEIAQDAFLKVFQHRDVYEERGQFAPYLYRIATNLLRSEDRKSRRREVLLGMFSARRNGHNGVRPSQEAQLLHGELCGHLERAIAALPLRFRSPLLLREIEGWSYRDIASVLDCREGTVKSRVHRGREKLRTLLTPYWNGGRT